MPPKHRALRYSDHIVGRGREVFAQACRAGAEGIVSKNRSLPYQPGRSRGWLKTKCTRRQEFVIGGFTQPQGSRAGIGALLVGVNDAEGRLLYCGKVGTGFTQKGAGELRRRVETLVTDKCPFQPRPKGVAKARWLRPNLVGEVEFMEWTNDGKIRHPSFKGLRADKVAREVIRETPRETGEVMRIGNSGRRTADGEGRARAISESPSSARSGIAARRNADREPEVAGIRISHPDRVVYPDVKLTKLEIAQFYERIADKILPHLAGRPLTLVRCPEGVGSSCFYMKHSNVLKSPGLRKIRIREKTKVGEYLIVDSLEGLISLVQMGVLEFHTWNSIADDLEKPNRIVFDLDPGPEVKWPAVIAAAQLVRTNLSSLGLESFVKTTGGRGLHVVVPFAPSFDWDTGLAFSRAVAESIEKRDPHLYTTAFAKAGRQRKILIDYMRNSRGSTSVAAFSTRARPGATVSFPIAWEELQSRRAPDYYDVHRLRRILSNRLSDPWKGFWNCKQRIASAGRKKLPESK